MNYLTSHPVEVPKARRAAPGSTVTCSVCRRVYRPGNRASERVHGKAHARWEHAVRELGYTPDTYRVREGKKAVGFRLFRSGLPHERLLGAEIVLRAYFDASLERAIHHRYYRLHPYFAEYVRMRMLEFDEETQHALQNRFGPALYQQQLQGTIYWSPERCTQVPLG